MRGSVRLSFEVLSSSTLGRPAEQTDIGARRLDACQRTVGRMLENNRYIWGGQIEIAV